MDNQDDKLRGKARLRRILNIMFPSVYIESHHRPPNSPCSVFMIKSNASICRELDFESVIQTEVDDEVDNLKSLVGLHEPKRQGVYPTDQKYEPSTEPSSRARVVQLCEQFNLSLIEHQAQPVGLCRIRRAIYDQCFDEIIRQVTVCCIEQGILLFRIRNELHKTLNQFEEIYKSGVRFGINKAIDAEIKIKEIESKGLEVLSQGEQDRNFIETGPPEGDQSSIEKSNEIESLARVKEYYQNELGKREQIISEQRNIIEALTKKFTQAIKNPLD